VTTGADVTLDGGWQCLDCGRVRLRDDVFVHDAGPICRDREDCYRARDEDDQNDYRPYRDDRGPA
jgi:hypothetical protein